MKRITNLLTPVPGQPPETAKTDTPPPSSASSISRLLRELLKDRFVVNEELRGHLDQLKHIAAQYGLAWTASEIHDSVLRLPDEIDGAVLKKGRGFELAADFYRQHLMRTAAAVEADPKAVDAAEFGRVSAEIVSCEFAARKYARGVEILIGITDALVLKACDVTPQRRLYLQLAVQSLQSAYRWSIDSGTQLERSLRRTRKPEDGSETIDSELDIIIHAPLLQYLKTRADHAAQLAGLLEMLEAVPVIPMGKLPSTKPGGDAWEAQKRYVKGLHDRIQAAGLLSVRAHALEWMATMAHTERPGSGSPMFQAAARIQEEIGKAEIDLGLAHLGGERLKKAMALAQLGDQPDEAARIEAAIPRKN